MKERETRRTRSTQSWLTLVILTAVLFSTGGCGDDDSGHQPAASFDPVLATRLQERLDQSREQHHALGTVVGVQSADGAMWFGASGFARADQTVALQPTDRFRVASVTKLFTAALIFQLVDEQRLHLDDTLDAWYPSIAGAEQITIRTLLNHTSGIPDYVTLVAQDQHWEPDDIIDTAVAGGLLYPPGSQFTYANTNYFLLARIIEKVTSSSYAAELRSRLLDPLGLEQTFLSGEEAIPGGFVQGTRRRGNGTYVDITDSIDSSVMWSAGGLVSNAPDMLRWAHALFGGQVLRPESLAEMIAPAVRNDGTQVENRGNGVEFATLPAGTRLGHRGNVMGFASSLLFLPERQLTVVALSNNEIVGWFIAEDIWSVLTAG